jgi:hypothetical protein
LRVDIEQHVEVLRRDLAAVHRQLATAREEAALLRQWREAYVAHQKARHELDVLHRQRAIERAWEAERDPEMPLH